MFAKAIAAEIAGNGALKSISGWLHRIAHNLVIDYYRQRDRRRDVALDAVEPLPAREPTPHEVYETEERHAWLGRAITRLTDAQADVIDLQRQGYGYDEIASMCGKTLGATKALRHRAVAALSMKARTSIHNARVSQL